MSVADSPILPQPEAQPPIVDAGVAGDMTPVTEVEPQGVEVAGPFKDAIGAVAGAVVKPIDDFANSAEARSFGDVPEANVFPGPGDSLVIKAMPNEDLERLNQSIAGNSGVFSAVTNRQAGAVNLGRIGEIFNAAGTDDFNLETVLTNIKTNNTELFAHLRRDTKSMDELMTLAEATGFEKIAYKFLGRKPGAVLPPEEVLAGMVGVIKLGQEIEVAAKAVINFAEGSPEKLMAFKKMRMLGAVTSNLAAQVSGNVSEYGRGLGIISSISKLNLNAGDYAEQLDRFVDEMDEGMMDYHAQVLLSMENPAARAKYAEKGIISKGYDFAMENYINAILSGPVSHTVNLAGNMSFQIMTLAERGLAGVIGNIRTVGGRRGEIGDQAYMGEASAEAFGFMMAQRDAFTLMGKTFVTGQSSDLMTKIDLKEQRAVGRTDNLVDIAKGVYEGDFFPTAIDAFGIATRMSGRLLATEDEFFKVITRRRVLYREAHRAAQIAYQSARKAGLSRSDAQKLSKKKAADIMVSPPDAVQKMMVDDSRQMTFQGQPKGWFGRMGPLINEFPLMKVIAPFYNTPTNIINEAFDRTLNWSPIYRAIKQNTKAGALLPALGDRVGGNAPIAGKEIDQAISKLAIGNSIALTMFGIASNDGYQEHPPIISGYLGAVQNVFGLKGYAGEDYMITGNISDDLSAQYNIAGSAGVPLGSVGTWNYEKEQYEFTTFTRFDPISALLFMGSDMAEYVKYSDDEVGIAELTAAYTLAVAEYATSMPFLQGMSDLAEVFFNGRGSQEDGIARALQFLGTQAGTVGTNVLGNVDQSTLGLLSYANEFLRGDEYPLISQTSLMATLERLNDPVQRSTKLPPGTAPFTDDLYTELPPFMTGFYTALQKAKARNPNFSEGLPKGLNFWGEEKYQGRGTRLETINPFKIQDGAYSSLDEELIRLAEVGAGVFGFHRDRIGQTKLNNEQFSVFISTINTIDDRGYMPDDIYYDETEKLVIALDKMLTSEEYADAITDDDKFDLLSGVLIERRTLAKEYMAGRPGTKSKRGMTGVDIMLESRRQLGEL